MKILGIILLITVYLGVMVFFVVFYKNDYKLEPTIKWFKKKLGKCCIKNKKIIEKMDEESASKLMQVYEKDIEDCHNPANIKINVCIDEEVLSPEDAKLRARVGELLAQAKRTVYDGGTEKFVIPLEATVALTKRMKPLVTEDGEILVKIDTETIPSPKNSPETLLEMVKIELEKNEKGRENELLENLLSLEKIKSRLEKKKEEDDKAITAIDSGSVETEKKGKSDTKTNDKNEIDHKKSRENATEEPLIEINENISSENGSASLNGISFDLTDIDSLVEKAGSAFEEGESNDKEIILEPPIEMPEETEENEAKGFVSKEEFYINHLSFSAQKEYSFDLDGNIEEDFDKVRKVVSEFYDLFVRNLAKTQPLVYTESKEAVWVPEPAIFSAFAHLYGVDHSIAIDFLQKLSNKDKRRIMEAILSVFKENNDTVEDSVKAITLITGSGSAYYTNALKIDLKAFAKGLKTEEFDYFRSFGYNTEMSIPDSKPKRANKLFGGNIIDAIID